MNKIFFSLTLSSVLLLAACSEEAAETTEPAVESEEATSAETNAEKAEPSADVETVEEDEASEEPAEGDSHIDTSVFEYAIETRVVDAIDINNHVTVFVTISEEVLPGLGVQHVVTQTYDFLQQDDVEGADTVSINVNQGDQKIAMYTVQKDNFTLNDEEPMSDMVMAAAEMEFMTPEVEEFGKTMDSW